MRHAHRLRTPSFQFLACQFQGFCSVYAGSLYGCLFRTGDFRRLVPAPAFAQQSVRPSVCFCCRMGMLGMAEIHGFSGLSLGNAADDRLFPAFSCADCRYNRHLGPLVSVRPLPGCHRGTARRAFPAPPDGSVLPPGIPEDAAGGGTRPCRAGIPEPDDTCRGFSASMRRRTAVRPVCAGKPA